MASWTVEKTQKFIKIVAISNIFLHSIGATSMGTIELFVPQLLAVVNRQKMKYCRLWWNWFTNYSSGTYHAHRSPSWPGALTSLAMGHVPLSLDFQQVIFFSSFRNCTKSDSDFVWLRNFSPNILQSVTRSSCSLVLATWYTVFRVIFVWQIIFILAEFCAPVAPNHGDATGRETGGGYFSTPLSDWRLQRLGSQCLHSPLVMGRYAEKRHWLKIPTPTPLPVSVPSIKLWLRTSNIET